MSVIFEVEVIIEDFGVIDGFVYVLMFYMFVVFLINEYEEKFFDDMIDKFK